MAQVKLAPLNQNVTQTKDLWKLIQKLQMLVRLLLCENYWTTREDWNSKIFHK